MTQRTPLIITADDYGLTDATSRTIVELARRGAITATSVLAVAPGVAPRLRWLDEVPELSVGAHLAVVGEDPPLLAAREIPTLVDRRGRLAASWRALLPRLVAGRVDPADLRRELTAQIAVVASRRPLTHLDTHQHVHLWPTVGDVVIELARASSIGAVRVPRSASSGARGRAIGRLADRLAHRVAAAGLSGTERFRGLDEAGAWSSSRLVATLDDLAGGSGSVEINVHPGAGEDPERGRYAWGYAWGEEQAALLAPVVGAAIERGGFELVGR